jgi:hypothetical protein
VQAVGVWSSSSASVAVRAATRRSSSSVPTTSSCTSRQERWIIASRNAATPKVITIAVRMRAWGSGSLISPGSVIPTIGARPASPPLDSSSRLVALPSSRKPRSTRVRLRSSSRYTPAA